jgi:hypothetical protein
MIGIGFLLAFFGGPITVLAIPHGRGKRLGTAMIAVGVVLMGIGSWLIWLRER